MEIEDLLDCIRAVVLTNLLILRILLLELENTHKTCLWLWLCLFFVVLLFLLFPQIDIKVVWHHEGIFKRTKSIEAWMSKLRMMLVHLVYWHWLCVDFWESEVTLLKNVFLVELWNTFHVGSCPSFEHDLSKIRLVLFDSICRTRVSWTGINESTDVGLHLCADIGFVGRNCTDLALI